MGLTVACVQVGNYEGRGAQYVNNLAAMVRRNITRPYRFVCLTDDPKGLHDGIEAKPLPSIILRGWWAKLYLFAPNVFPVGERVLYFDLDTLILDNIDDYADYGGEFAGLGCFRSHRIFGSGLMAWPAGSVDHIWTDWMSAGRPVGDGADDSWIASVHPDAVRIQRKLQGVVSYKFHKCAKGPPEGARIVCFQRRPKPHECTNWVKQVWTDGGGAAGRA